MGCLGLFAAFLGGIFLFLVPVGVETEMMEPPPAESSVQVVTVVPTLPPPPALDDPYLNIPKSRGDDGAFVLGVADAPITIIVFKDFLCPHCQTYKTTTDAFIDEYVYTGWAKFEYRFVPVVDPVFSVVTARLAECADLMQPGSFWLAHDVLFDIASTERFSESSVGTFASRMNMDETALTECVLNEDQAFQVDVDLQFAMDLGVQGTPSVAVRYDDGTVELLSGGAPGLEGLGAIVEAAQ